MKKKKFLHTNFVKFLVEKYKEELQDIPDDAQEEIENDEDLVDEVQLQVQEEQEEENQNEDEDDFDKLVREYNELEKKYNKRKNGRIYNKRK